MQQHTHTYTSIVQTLVIEINTEKFFFSLFVD